MFQLFDFRFGNIDAEGCHKLNKGSIIDFSGFIVANYKGMHIESLSLVNKVSNILIKNANKVKIGSSRNILFQDLIKHTKKWK